MTYSEEFSRAAQRCEDNGLSLDKMNDACIAYEASYDNVRTIRLYDFLARTVTTVIEVASGNDSSHIEPFADIDGETLAYMRDKLTELGGNPPPLPAADGQRTLIGKGPR